MSDSKKDDLPFSPQVAELRRVLDEAAGKSPELWATIERSVVMAELVSNSMQAQNARESVQLSTADETGLRQTGV